MTFAPVPTVSIAVMMLNLLICAGVPLALLIVLRKKYRAKIRFFLCGCICFPLFALGLESAFHRFVLTGPLGATIQGNIRLYALYAGLAAGVFEEMRRVVYFFLLSKQGKAPQNALMYGAGHGGIEAVLIVGTVYVNNLVYSILINTGRIEATLAAMDETTAAALANGLAALSATSPLLFLAAGAERLMAIGLHIALSVLVFAGVRKKKPGYVLLAIALHAAVDAVSVLLAQKVGVAAVEICVFLMTAGVAAIALRVYRAMQAEDLTEAAPNAEASVRA